MRRHGETQFKDISGIFPGSLDHDVLSPRRYRPDPALADVVDHYWYLDWTVDKPFVQHVLPPPAINIVFHESGGRVFGAMPGRHGATYRSAGRVLGVRVRPGRFPAHLGAPLT